MDRRPCPLCKHYLVRKLHTKELLLESQRQVERQKARRDAEQAALPVSERKKTRHGKAKVQEYYCICIQKGNNRDSDGKICKCCVGPFTDAMRESLFDWHEEYKEENEDAEPVRTTSDNAGSIFRAISTASIDVSFPSGFILVPLK